MVEAGATGRAAGAGGCAHFPQLDGPVEAGGENEICEVERAVGRVEG